MKGMKKSDVSKDVTVSESSPAPSSTKPLDVTAASSASAETSLDTPRRFLQSGILTLYVGNDRKKFQIHKDLLRAKSKYFERLLADDSSWVESKKDEVTWNDTEEGISVTAVEVWADWLYGKPICNTLSTVLFQCYKLADKRMMPEFKNDVMDACRHMFREKNMSADANFLRHSKELGLQHTPIHQFVLESMVRSILVAPKSWPENSVRRKLLNNVLADAELAQQVMHKVLEHQTKPWGDPSVVPGCFFHDHSDGSICGKGVTG